MKITGAILYRSFMSGLIFMALGIMINMFFPFDTFTTKDLIMLIMLFVAGFVLTLIQLGNKEAQHQKHSGGHSGSHKHTESSHAS
jgi:hypothetical protein